MLAALLLAPKSAKTRSRPNHGDSCSSEELIHKDEEEFKEKGSGELMLRGGEPGDAVEMTESDEERERQMVCSAGEGTGFAGGPRLPAVVVLIRGGVAAVVAVVGGEDTGDGSSGGGEGGVWDREAQRVFGPGAEDED